MASQTGTVTLIITTSIWTSYTDKNPTTIKSDDGRFKCPPPLSALLPANTSQFTAVVTENPQATYTKEVIIKDGETFNWVISCTYTVFAIHPSATALSPGSSSSTSTTSQTTSKTTRTSKAATSTTRSDSIQSGSTKKGGVPAGSVAGIAIGLFAAGILAAFAVWFCLARRRRSRDGGKQGKAGLFGRAGTDEGTDGLRSTPGPILAPVKGSTSSSSAIIAASGRQGARPHGAGKLDFYLLDGAGDSEIKGELTSLGYLLKDHVETSYHSPQATGQHHVSASVVAKMLADLGISDPATQIQIANLSLSGRTRSIAIRSVLAFVIFSALDIHSDMPSLLPPVLVSFVRAVPKATRESASPQDSQAFNTWRRTAAYLLHPSRHSRTPLPVSAGGEVGPQIRDFQASLGGFLSFFLDGRATQDNNKQARGLEQVIRAFIKLGYVVFSHPCEWRYSYQAESTGRGGGSGSGSSRLPEVVVLPGLERVTGPDGEAYKTRQVVAWPVTEKV